MIDYTLRAFGAMREVDEIIVISNAKFFSHFSTWARARISPSLPPLSVINDGSLEEAGKRGAIGDILFALESQYIEDDLIIVAGDNLFTNPIEDFFSFVLAQRTPVLGIYDVGTLEEAKKFGVVEINSQGMIVRFEEKPSHPSSTLIGIALYFYPREVLHLIRQYVALGNSPDQPGRLIQWLYPQVSVYTWKVPGEWYDIGSKETLEKADRIFQPLRQKELY